GQAGESYPGIGKASVPLLNMPLLSDGDGPFGSPTSDSTRGMTTPDTKEGLTVLYSFSGREVLAFALEQAARQFITFAGITAVQTWIVD
ncbi:MAG: hypothetical protein LBC14_05075, partial [Desulfovibrio sp.]|nr:hypothetical protein [Desulfovibrio sp.]